MYVGWLSVVGCCCCRAACAVVNVLFVCVCNPLCVCVPFVCSCNRLCVCALFVFDLCLCVL